MSHADTAYAYAKAHNWTIDQVRGATRAQVATACGVNLPVAKPATFLAWNIKGQVVRRLEADAVEADRVALKVQVKAFADTNGLRLQRIKEGEDSQFSGVLVGRAE